MLIVICYWLIASISNYIKVSSKIILQGEGEMTLLDNGNVRNEAWKAETRKGFINNSRLAIDGCKDGNRFIAPTG